MRTLNGIRNLPSNMERLLNRNRTLCDALNQGGTLDQLHYQGDDVVGVLQAVDVRDMRMIQRGENLSLALKPGETFGISKKGFGEHLQGIVPLEARVVCAPDPAHATLADQGCHLIWTDASAWAYGHSERILRDTP